MVERRILCYQCGTKQSTNWTRSLLWPGNMCCAECRTRFSQCSACNLHRVPGVKEKSSRPEIVICESCKEGGLINTQCDAENLFRRMEGRMAKILGFPLYKPEIRIIEGRGDRKLGMTTCQLIKGRGEYYREVACVSIRRGLPMWWAELVAAHELAHVAFWTAPWRGRIESYYSTNLEEEFCDAVAIFYVMRRGSRKCVKLQLYMARQLLNLKVGQLVVETDKGKALQAWLRKMKQLGGGMFCGNAIPSLYKEICESRKEEESAGMSCPFLPKAKESFYI